MSVADTPEDLPGPAPEEAARSLRFVGPRSVRLETGEVPSPDDDEVVVESLASLVSAGTELMIYRGEAPEDLPADETIDALSGDLSFPLEYGYSLVGDVARVGAEVPAEWLGRRVFAFNPHESHFAASPDSLVPVPDDVDAETAVFLPIVETAVNLVMDAAPRIGERAVVFGAGLVGLATVASLAEFPLADLTVVEPIPVRRDLAMRLGADAAVAPADAADVEEADLVVELSGSPEALDDAVDVAGYDARVVVGSWYGRKRADLDLGGAFHRERVSIVSSQVSTISPKLRGRWDAERRMTVAWSRLRELPVAELVTHRLPIEEAERAYEMLDGEPEEALGVLFEYR